MKAMIRGVFAVAGVALLLGTSASFAQQPPPVRVRGTVEAVDGPVLTVKSRDGKTTYKVKLTDNASVRGIVKAPLSDIKDNSFIGVTGMPQSKSISSPRRCAAPARVIGPGIWCRTAP
jgi:hypothetical protein